MRLFPWNVSALMVLLSSQGTEAGCWIRAAKGVASLQNIRRIQAAWAGSKRFVGPWTGDIGRVIHIGSRSDKRIAIAVRHGSPAPLHVQLTPARMHVETNKARGREYRDRLYERHSKDVWLRPL